MGVMPGPSFDPTAIVVALSAISLAFVAITVAAIWLAPSGPPKTLERDLRVTGNGAAAGAVTLPVILILVRSLSAASTSVGMAGAFALTGAVAGCFSGFIALMLGRDQ